MKQRRRRLKGATDLHLSLYTEAVLPIHPPPLTVGRNGRRTAMSTCGMRLFEWGGWIAAARQSQDESSPCSLICACRVTALSDYTRPEAVSRGDGGVPPTAQWDETGCMRR